MKNKSIACVVGARPNFMKMAPILRSFESDKYRDRVDATLIHTGQHYDANLSDIFFSDLGMRRPDVCLEIGSGSHGVQTAKVLERMEEVLLSGPSGDGKFDLLIVVGDVNSTLAAALAAVKIGIRVAHVEAGLRSFDRNMPEEINRLLTDSISDLLLVSEPCGVTNLLREGRPESAISLVGNVMIDSLRYFLPRAKATRFANSIGLEDETYGIVTLHRPSNVDDAEKLSNLLEVLVEAAERMPLVFPMHPRTRAAIERFDLTPRLESAGQLRVISPLGYLDFLSLVSSARYLVTDSGGLQEESTALGIPCLTLRCNTERPITVDLGTSTLIGDDAARLKSLINDILDDHYKTGECPELWDGQAADRISHVVLDS